MTLQSFVVRRAGRMEHGARKMHNAERLFIVIERTQSLGLRWGYTEREKHAPFVCNKEGSGYR